MKSRLLLAVFLWFAGAAFGAAPDSVVDLLYTEETVTAVRSNAADAFVLRADGTYRGLYHVITYGTQTVGIPRDGTWTYRKTTAETAELVLDGAQKRLLQFTNDSRGSLSGGATNPLLSGSFTLTDSSRPVPLVNCSNRSFVSDGRGAITGVVLTEPFNAILVRAVGPGLTAYGVAPVLPRPVLRIYRGNAEIPWSSANGGESLRRTTAYVGAFALPASSADSAAIVILPAGGYTATVSNAQAGESGEVLIEAYIVR